MEDSSKEAVEAVLKQEFTAPNEEFVELNNYIEEAYGPYFTESEFDNLVNNG